MKWLAFLVALAAGCSSVPEGGTVDIQVRNDTDRELTTTIEAGFLSKSVVLPPHSIHSWWIYRAFLPKAVVVVVKESR